MTRQYLRACQLTADSTQILADVDTGLRVRFQVRHAELGTPQSAVIVVSNLASKTENQLMKERLVVSLKAGYRENADLIFKGETIQVIKGRENPVETTLTMVLRNSDTAHNYGVVNKTLPAKHTVKDRVDACVEALKKHGVTVGNIPDLGNIKFPRPRIMSGMAKDYLREICFAAGATWSIQNDRLQIVKNNETLPGSTIVLNSRTGLIGRPQQTLNGIEARCLLNPNIRPGVKVKIDESSINRQQLSPAYLAEVNNSMIPDVASDGVYKVLYVDEEGDTRGGPWYTSFVCLSASSDKIPLGLAQRGITDKAALDQEYSRG